MKTYLIDMRAIVARHASEFRNRETQAVRALPAFSLEAFVYGDKVKCNVYHDVTPSGQHIVVVQAVRDSLFGMAYASVIDGFAIETDGTRRDLTEDEKFRYD